MVAGKAVGKGRDKHPSASYAGNDDEVDDDEW
jgi:hypothetical protein